MTTGPSLAAALAQDPTHLRRADNSERFVAFAFAGSDIVVETDRDGGVSYAAGAFRSKFGHPPEHFVGRDVRDLVSSQDHEVLNAALATLVQRGRLLPMMIRLSDAERTPLALAGMALPAQDRPLRLCLSFARPPAPLSTVLKSGGPLRMARLAETRLRAGEPCDVNFLELIARTGTVFPSGEAIGHILEKLAPGAVASELSPGRYGLLSQRGAGAGLLEAAGMLEAALGGKACEFSVAERHLPLQLKGLTPTQAARALRQALNSFARGGTAGFDEAGLGGGLAGYIRRASAQAGSLRALIRGGRFSLAFQPVVHLADRGVHHYEALIRPRPLPDCALSGPQEFITLVEALGLADELDLAVAQQACAAAEAARVLIAFNLSGQSVQSAGFRNRLVQLLTASPARRAGLIMVELTETAEIEDVEEAKRTTDALRALKVPFCLDDFGAGTMDIKLLRALAPDIVKLDGSYVAGIGQDGRERAFLMGMVDIARAAGAKVVAERVEIEAEAGALLALGVQFGQGWLFGRPGPLPLSPEVGVAKLRRAAEKETWS